MCLSTPKAPPPPPPPPPPTPPAPVPELKREDDADYTNDPAGTKKGRKKLRIDLASGAGTNEGTGLNIPQ